MKIVDEADLITRARRGDEAALERLLLSCYERLEQRIERRMPAALRCTEAAEDILQQTFIGAFQGIGTFEPRGDGAFYGWLCAIAEHRIQDALKHHNAARRGGGRAIRRGDDGVSMAGLIELLAGPRRTPSQSVARHEAAAAVHAAMQRLAPDTRQALQLRYVQRLPVGHTAATMQRTPRAVHNLCYRGLRELMTLLGSSSRYLTRS